MVYKEADKPDLNQDLKIIIRQLQDVDPKILSRKEAIKKKIAFNNQIWSFNLKGLILFKNRLYISNE